MARTNAPPTGRAALLGAYLAPEVVAHIMSDGRVPLLSGVRLPVTILFADMSGFTRLAAALPAERVVALLDDFFAAMTGAAAGSDAMIDKLIGDAVMLVFGVPGSKGDEAIRALRVATAMHDAFERLRRRWQRSCPEAMRLGLAIGCASGPAVLANVGSAARMDYTVVGDAVNRAARLVAAARGGRTLVDANVRTQALQALVGQARHFRFGACRQLKLKGFRGTVPAYSASATVRTKPTPGVQARRLEDPICGMKLSPPAPFVVTRRGHQYPFCSRRCRDTFVKQR